MTHQPIPQDVNELVQNGLEGRCTCRRCINDTVAAIVMWDRDRRAHSADALLDVVERLPSKYSSPNFAVWLFVALHSRYGIGGDLSVKQIRALIAEYDPSATGSVDASPTESILHPLADREKSADTLMDQAQGKRRHAAALIADAEMLEQLAYDTADYCGGGEP